MSDITPATRSKEITGAYVDTCSYASALRARLSKGKANLPKSLFFKFRARFDYLVMITCDMRAMRETQNTIEMVNTINEWLKKEQKAPSKDTMFNGIDMFSKYKIELINKQIVDEGAI